MKNYNERICIVGAGELSKKTFDLVYNGEPIIAVDGGLNRLQDFGMQPQFVIGDMDSVEDTEEVEVLHIQDQDSTDLEKCLLNVQAPQYLGMGFLGSRFDHNFEVLHVLTKYLDKNLIFFSEEDVIFRLPREFEIQLPIGTRFSIYPLVKTVFESSKGLKYALDGLEMEQGKMIGTSNQTSSESTKIIQREPGSIAILPIEFFNLII